MRMRFLRTNIVSILIMIFVIINSLSVVPNSVEQSNDSMNLKFHRSYTYQNIGTLDTIIVPDDYPTIQAAIDHANNGDTILVQPGTYRENIEVDKSIQLIGNGPDYTTIEGVGTSSIVVMIHADSVTLKDFTIANGKIAGLWIQESCNCIITNNRFEDNQYGCRMFYSKHNVIDHNIFKECGLGIYGKTLADFIHTVQNNTINDRELYYASNQSNLYIDGKENDYGSIILVNCINTTINEFHYLYDAEIGIELAYCNNVTVTQSHMKDNYFGLYLRDCQDVIIQDNLIVYNEIGIHLRQSSSTVKGNNISTNMYGLESWNSSENLITGNHFYNNSIAGLYLWHNSHNNTIANGNFFFNNVNGIDIYSSYDNLIENNTIMHNSYSGIFLKNALRNTFQKNTIQSNDLRGVDLKHSSNNSIINNTIISNGYYGVYFEDSHNNKIHRNRLLENGNGICFYSSSNNNDIDSNIIVDNSANGIQVMRKSNDNYIHMNEINSNFLNGLYLESTNGNIISECNISDHELSGIDLIDSSHTTVERCALMDNWRGIRFDSQKKTNSNIISCIFDNNYWGIKLGDSMRNTIEQCAFSNNIVGVMRGKNNIIRYNNFMDNKGFDVLGEIEHKNFCIQNYYNAHQTILPHHLFGLNIDWLPRVEPYDVGS